LKQFAQDFLDDRFIVEDENAFERHGANPVEVGKFGTHSHGRRSRPAQNKRVGRVFKFSRAGMAEFENPP
jgi:hypothetical protein